MGNFTTTINQKGEKRTNKIKLVHGIIIVATGAKEYQGTDYLYSKNKDVLTQIQLSQRLKKMKFDLKKQVSCDDTMCWFHGMSNTRLQ